MRITEKDFTGHRFGKLVVIKRKKHRKLNCFWICQCDCGKNKITRIYLLLSGETQSCGCYQKQRASECSITHGATVNRSKTPEYDAWTDMKKRCRKTDSKRNKSYQRNGIKVCKRFYAFFSEFFADLGKKPSPAHSLDRINPRLHYSCGKCDDCNHNEWSANCRWATLEQQANNKTSSRLFELPDGTKLTVAQLSRKYGIYYQTLYHRLVIVNRPIEIALKPLLKNSDFKSASRSIV